MKKFIYILLLLLLIFGGIVAYRLYVDALNPNVKSSATAKSLYIYPESTWETVLDSIKAGDFLINPASFEFWAERKKLPENLKPGHYQFSEGQSNNSLINILLSGSQRPVRITLHDIIDRYDLAGTLNRYLLTDSISILNLMQNEALLQRYGLNPQTATAVFLPNTYEVYWTISPEDLLERMHDEFNRFWKDDRVERAQKLGLSPIEVVSLASIVERETVRPDEKPLVARLYLNRLDKGMKLESDPTVIFGINLDHPKRRITRVYYSDLDYESPYNTYRNAGLPPGPIKTPAISSIEAVLQAPQHDYIFMVADPVRPGYHRFAVNYRQHQQNVAFYRANR